MKQPDDLEPRTSTDLRQVPAAVGRKAYYVIDRGCSAEGETFRVWRRTAGNGRAELLSEHQSMVMATSSLPVSWRKAASGDIEAWGFWQANVLPEGGSRFAPMG